jgi:hypothetical protein
VELKLIAPGFIIKQTLIKGEIISELRNIKKNLATIAMYAELTYRDEI